MENRPLIIRKLQEFLLVQFFLGYVFLVSGIFVNMIQFLTAIFIWPRNRSLYRKLNYHLASIIWSQMTFVYQWWSNSDIIVYIQPKDLEKMRQENSLWLGNHRYEVDWLLGWVVTERLGLTGGSKILGKESLRMLPIIGWCWHFTESIFLRRVWSTDKTVLERDIRQLVDNYPSNYNFTLFLSCEGTRYTEEKRLESMKIARAKGLPELQHHILPRTKGFVLLIKGIHRHITAVYDITTGFNGSESPDLAKILRGQSFQGEAFVRRIPIEEIPFDDEDKSAEFIQKLFQEKDKIFDHFARNGTFEGAGNPRAIGLKRRSHDLIIELLCLILIGLPSIYLFIKFILFASFFIQITFLLCVITAIIAARLIIPRAKRQKSTKIE